MSAIEALIPRATTAEFGEMLTYREIENATGLDRASARTVIYRLMRKLEKEYQRTLVCEPKQGYRIARPEEHENLGYRHSRKSARQLASARRKWKSADRSQLPLEVVQRLDALEMQASRQEQAIRSLEKRQAQMEEALDSVRQQAEGAADLSERLERAEELIGQLFEQQNKAA